MLKTNQSAENLSSSIAKDAEVGSVDGDDCEDEMVKKSPLTSKNSNKATGYLTPGAK